jgi:hypothetical protein
VLLLVLALALVLVLAINDSKFISEFVDELKD